MIAIVVERCADCPFLTTLAEDGFPWACVGPSFDGPDDEEPAMPLGEDITGEPPKSCPLRTADRLVTLRRPQVTLPALSTVLCACTWFGPLPKYSSCPGCGADTGSRVTKARLAKLRAVAARQSGDRPVAIEPAMVRWFVDQRHRLLEPTSPPPAPSSSRYTRRPMRAYRLSPAGERVIVAAQLAEREAGLRREIIAESVARHAGIEEP